MKNKSHFITVCIIAIILINFSIKNSPNKQVEPIEVIDTIIAEDTLNDIYIESRVRLIESVDNYIKSIAPTSVIDSEYLIDMCDLYWRGHILDETYGYSFCDTERDVESLSIKEQSDDCWEFVMASGGLREFDFEP